MAMMINETSRYRHRGRDFQRVGGGVKCKVLGESYAKYLSLKNNIVNVHSPCMHVYKWTVGNRFNTKSKRIRDRMKCLFWNDDLHKPRALMDVLLVWNGGSGGGDGGGGCYLYIYKYIFSDSKYPDLKDTKFRR